MERRKGTIRNQSEKNNPLHQNFKIDDRSFETILAYITSYLGHINFYSTTNKMDGNWDALVLNDPIIYMAGIIEKPLNTIVARTADDQKIQELLDWYAKIEEWYGNLNKLNEKKLADKIRNIIVDVLEDKKKILLARKKPEPALQSPSKPTLMSPVKPEVAPDIPLEEIANTFKKAILHIQNFTRDYLRNHIFSKNDHMPNNAMYIAFAFLYQKIQEQINEIPRRHLDFYYKDILKQTLDPGIPTNTIVCFEVLKESRNVDIPKGTVLSAGKLFGNKKEVLFKTKRPILANPIQVESLRTLYFNKNPYIKIGTDAPVISNIIKKDILSAGKKIEGVKKWPLFGADQDILLTSKVTTTTRVDIGFMIGSPVLFMEDGNREISMTFTFVEDSWNTIFWKLVQQIMINENSPLDVVFNRIFEKTFQIQYSSEKGWETLTSYELLLEEESRSFVIRFVLGNSAPPITSLTSEAQYSEWPMIKVLLDEYAPVYTYSFFKGMELESVGLEVNVTEIKNVSLYNNVGKMPLTKSFDLFGPLPSLGGYLMIGKSELFKKELMNFDIHIHWDNTPKDLGGFPTYYDAYEETFSNDSFKVVVQALSNAYWFPRDPDVSDAFDLFGTENCLSPEGYETVMISPKRSIAVDTMGVFEFSRNYGQKDPIKYDIRTEGGFIKLTLIAPDDAFGKELYQKNYAQIAMYNAKNEASLPLPNTAFVPKVKEVSLDYTARDIIYFNNSFSSDDNSNTVVGDYIHITPFGTQKTVSDSRVYKNTMIADFEGEGYLYIVLSGVDPQIGFSVYFDLWNTNPEHNAQIENIVFQYKELDHWEPLDKKHIITDGTNQLTKSGIVELTLPNHLHASNGRYELRLIAKADAYVYPILSNLYPNAVETSCINEEVGIIGKEVEPFTISKLQKKIVGIKKIQQPSASYGGKLPGTPEQFYTDVSERLRNKDRAVIIKDYEQLILRYFHQVAVVKCTNLDECFKPVPGKIQLVVLGLKWTHEHHWYFNADQLDGMTQFIKKKSNSFINIQVRNPSVEWLLVNCVVEFYAEDKGGYYMNELNAAINAYLCPLTHNDDDSMDGKGIGAIIVPRMLMSYIENITYIKSVKKLDIEHIVKHGINDFTVKVYEENQEVKATRPWAILTPETKHNIFLPSILEKNTMKEIETQNYQIGIDYIIAGDLEEKEKVENTVVEEKGNGEEEKEKTSPPKPDTILTFKVE